MNAVAGPPSGAPAGASTYLDRIVPAVLRRLEERRRLVPQAQVEGDPGPGPRPSFADALRAPGISLIAEVKRASPSRGPIRPGLEVRSLVMSFEAAGASAVSVLTEEDHFRGSLEDLRAAVDATALPVLRKDFILDEYQVHEARASGASAVLLIAALLSEGEVRRLAGLASDLGLDVLLEVHDRMEMARALSLDGVVIGVNNRDLRTFAVSLDTTLELAALVPSERLLVGESGIRTHAEVERLAAAGVDGVLVGEGLLQSPDVDAAIRELMCPPPAIVPRAAARVWKEEA
ncbi:MAG: indole-3-glycerol phosphate synthase TrpC [bacterium]